MNNVIVYTVMDDERWRLKVQKYEEIYDFKKYNSRKDEMWRKKILKPKTAVISWGKCVVDGYPLPSYYDHFTRPILNVSPIGNFDKKSNCY